MRGYTDQEHLADSALIHMNGRVYDPQIGKFTGPDPLGIGYAYVDSNPLNSTDPTGALKNVAGVQTDIFAIIKTSDGNNISFTTSDELNYRSYLDALNGWNLSQPYNLTDPDAPENQRPAMPQPQSPDSSAGDPSQLDGESTGRSGSPSAPTAGSDFDIGGGVSNYCLSLFDCSAGATSADSDNAIVNNQIAASYSVQWVAQLTVPALAAHPAAMPGATRQAPAWTGPSGNTAGYWGIYQQMMAAPAAPMPGN